MRSSTPGRLKHNQHKASGSKRPPPEPEQKSAAPKRRGTKPKVLHMTKWDDFHKASKSAPSKPAPSKPAEPAKPAPPKPTEPAKPAAVHPGWEAFQKASKSAAGSAPASAAAAAAPHPGWAAFEKARSGAPITSAAAAKSSPLPQAAAPRCTNCGAMMNKAIDSPLRPTHSPVPKPYRCPKCGMESD
jgi:hypothetical protein